MNRPGHRQGGNRGTVFGLILIEAMRAPFRDPDWLRKLLLGALLGLVPVLNFVAWGYVYRVFIDALNGAERTILPEWRDWRAYLGAGFWLFIISIVYVVLGVVGLAGVASVLGLLPAGEDPARTSGLPHFMVSHSTSMRRCSESFSCKFAASSAEGSRSPQVSATAQSSGVSAGTSGVEQPHMPCTQRSIFLVRALRLPVARTCSG